MMVKQMGCDRICVVLPTYNGAQYIEAQLNSILEQTYEHIDIIIRDDGSTDGTIDIIQRVIDGNNTLKRISVISDDNGNIGCPEGFYYIVRSFPKYRYYAFCDQDDIWLPNKVERMVDALQPYDGSTPAVYFSSFDYVDQKGNLIRHAPAQPRTIGLALTLFYTPGLGFTIGFNNAAANRFIVNANPNREMHDRWVLRCASCFGFIISDAARTALHVRHDDAVTASDSGIVNLIRGFIETELCGDKIAKEASHIAEFRNQFGSKLSLKDQKVLDIFSTKGGVAKQIRKTLFPHRLRSTALGEIAIRILFILGRC